MSDSEKLFGPAVPLDGLSTPRSIAVAAFLRLETTAYAEAVSAHRDASGRETVVLDVEVEVPQHPVHPIARSERIAVTFRPDDGSLPEVLAVREDFPQVPHLNLREQEFPRSLCLYDAPWAELRLSWTAPRFIERIREWLALTARGELHGDDQPLEPILLSWEHHLVLPPSIFFSDGDAPPHRLYVELVKDGAGPGVLLARPPGHRAAETKGARFVATSFAGQPQQHGIIRRAPKTLEELHQLASTAGVDLKAELRKRLMEWRESDDIRSARLILVFHFPKTRTSAATPEAADIWAFALGATVSDLASKLQAWAIHGKHAGVILGADGQVGDTPGVPVSLLNPMLSLAGPLAALYNGESPSNAKVTAVGVGALGSQVLLNFVRKGFGQLTLIDDDRLFPHNLARHGLSGFAVGLPKAQAFATEAGAILDGDEAPNAIVANILAPGAQAKAVSDAITEADVILDFSASVPVARHLAAHEGGPRRVSVFLSPTGRDLVILAESQDRSVKLDELEHQLYRYVLTSQELAGHLDRPSERLRYGQSCRDVSTRLPQHLAALHAAIASKAIPEIVGGTDAAIRVWRTTDDLSVSAHAFQIAETRRSTVSGWTVVVDNHLLADIIHLRAEKLPKETGGVLLGSIDMERRIVYLAHTIPSPPDSKEWPTLYIRGSKGLARQVEQVVTETGGMLQYIGEWHSHPQGVPALPSQDDCIVFAWLTERLDQDGMPAVMTIAADGECSIFVGMMVKGRPPC